MAVTNFQANRGIAPENRPPAPPPLHSIQNFVPVSFNAVI